MPLYELYKEKIYIKGRLTETRFGLCPGISRVNSVEEVADYVKENYIPNNRVNLEEDIPIPDLGNMEEKEIKILDNFKSGGGIEVIVKTGFDDEDLEKFAKRVSK